MLFLFSFWEFSFILSSFLDSLSSFFICSLMILSSFSSFLDLFSSSSFWTSFSWYSSVSQNDMSMSFFSSILFLSLISSLSFSRFSMTSHSIGSFLFSSSFSKLLFSSLFNESLIGCEFSSESGLFSSLFSISDSSPFLSSISMFSMYSELLVCFMISSKSSVVVISSFNLSISSCVL